MGFTSGFSVLNRIKRRLQWMQRSSWRVFSVLFLVSLSLSLLSTSCGAPDSTVSQTSATPIENRVVRIGHQKFDPFTLVKARGELEKQLASLGVSVEWTEFQAGPPMLEALNVGSIDIGRTGDAPPVIAQAANAPFVYIGGSAPKDRSSALLVKSDSPIQSIGDLRGKKVGYTKGSSANYLLVKLLQEAGLTLSDVESVYLAAADARSAFEQGSIDAWVIWDPFYAAAAMQAKARVIRDSNGLAANRDFYLANNTYVEQNREVIDAIAQVTKETAAWADANPQEVVKILSPILGIEPAILDVVTKRRNYGFEPINDEMISEQQEIADTFFNLKLIPKQVEIADAVWKE